MFLRVNMFLSTFIHILLSLFNLNYFQIKANINGLSHSPKQQMLTTQQIKPSQSLNGVRPSYKYSQLLSSTLIPSNGRRHGHSDRSNDKLHENNEKNNDNTDKVFQAPVFAKPFKIPPHHDQSQSKVRSVSNQSETQLLPSDGNRDVESILKMMTSTLEPLTKIAATPRTEIEVQQPNRSYVYANLPPFLRMPMSNCSKFYIFI